MVNVEVFDPAMCCSTGVCGPSVDPTLATFAADLEWLVSQGVSVSRATVSQEPAKFVASGPVREAMAAHGEGALPAVLVDGVLRSFGAYPQRAELATWAGAAPASVTAPPGTRLLTLTAAPTSSPDAPSPEAQATPVTPVP